MPSTRDSGGERQSLIELQNHIDLRASRAVPPAADLLQAEGVGRSNSTLGLPQAHLHIDTTIRSIRVRAARFCCAYLLMKSMLLGSVWHHACAERNRGTQTMIQNQLKYIACIHEW